MRDDRVIEWRETIFSVFGHVERTSQEKMTERMYARSLKVEGQQEGLVRGDLTERKRRAIRGLWKTEMQS